MLLGAADKPDRRSCCPVLAAVGAVRELEG